jgi:hypothetical protein
MDTKFGFNANVKVELFGSQGELKDKREVHNAVTDSGVYLILDQSLDTPNEGKITYMALGTGNTMTSDGIQTTITGSYASLTSKTRTNKVVTMVGDWAAGVATATISEAGTLFQGNMPYPCMMYATFTGIVKGAADTLKITWTLTGAN